MFSPPRIFLPNKVYNKKKINTYWDYMFRSKRSMLLRRVRRSKASSVAELSPPPPIPYEAVITECTKTYEYDWRMCDEPSGTPWCGKTPLALSKVYEDPYLVAFHHERPVSRVHIVMLPKDVATFTCMEDISVSMPIYSLLYRKAECLSKSEMFRGEGRVMQGLPRDPAATVAALHILTSDFDGLFPPKSAREYNSYANKEYFVSLEALERKTWNSLKTLERLSLEDRDRLLDAPLLCVRCQNGEVHADWDHMSAHLATCTAGSASPNDDPELREDPRHNHHSIRPGSQWRFV